MSPRRIDRVSLRLVATGKAVALTVWLGRTVMPLEEVADGCVEGRVHPRS